MMRHPRMPVTVSTVLSCLIVGWSAGAGWTTAACSAQEPPRTPTEPVIDRFHHGATVTDPYRWLEDVRAPRVLSWVRRQNGDARRYIKKLPGRVPLRREVDKLFDEATSLFEQVTFRNGVLCAVQDGALVVMKSADDPEPLRILVDPDLAIPDHEVFVDFYDLSPDGSKVVVSLSLDGNEDGTLHVYETATGNRIDEKIPSVSGPPGGSVSWNHDGTGFYYTYYPLAANQQVDDRHRYALEEVRFHRLGSSVAADSYVCGNEFHRFPQIGIVTSRHTEDVLFQVSYGSGAYGQWLYLMQKGAIRRIAGPDDEVVAADFLSPDTLVIESCKEAPRGCLLTWPVNAPDVRRGTRLLVAQPPGEMVLHKWEVTASRLYVSEFRDGREHIRVVDKKSGMTERIVPLPKFTALTDGCRMAGDQFLYQVESYVRPATWYTLDRMRKVPRRVGMTESWDLRFDNVKVVRQWAIGTDGTQIPITVMQPRNVAKDGKRPVVLSVYGGSKIRETPWFAPERKVWFDRGGVWAFAHPRGEGELGEAWFRPTVRGHKQVTRDDTIACAEHLIQSGYTTPDKLALTGGSHGGLVAGMALIARPDLFAAALIDGGDLCPLRNGRTAFGGQLVCEYGTVADAAEFRRMRDYSPYQQIAADKSYPAVWLRCGLNDRRVLPWNSWKTAARLQATKTQRPILLTTMSEEGHDSFVPAEEDFAFLCEQLGVDVKAVD